MIKPSIDEVDVVSADELERTMMLALVAHGATPEDSIIQSRALLEAELRGHSSHGARRLRVLLGRLDTGVISSGVPAEHRWLTESVLHVDGNDGFGPVVALGATEAIIARAQETGVASAVISRANHLGMLAMYVERMAESGCAGIALTTSEALVHPWGGMSALIGTNPIGIAVPTATVPLVLDMSTAAVSAGKILDYAARGEPMPEGWAVDAEGVPTTDASAAALGSLSPFGGPKGYALGLALEVLIASITGTALGTGVHGTLDMKEPSTKGDVLIAISIERMGTTQRAAALSEYLLAIRSSGRDGEPLTIPGDRARASRSRRLAEGIPISRMLLAEVRRFAAGGRV